jgi:hypothetical protein
MFVTDNSLHNDRMERRGGGEEREREGEIKIAVPTHGKVQTLQ